MLKKAHKSLCLILLALLLCVPGTTALAAGETVDLERAGSISLTLRRSTGEQTEIPGGTFTLYQVAGAGIEENNLVYFPTEAFQDCGVSLTDLRDPGLAEHLEGYAAAERIAGRTEKADGATAVFDGLSAGLYLIVQKGSLPRWYPIRPFLVSIPMNNSDGSGWIYDVDASPKAQPRPQSPDPDETSITVRKLWEGEDENRPGSVTVNLLRDGEIYDTAVLRESNGWQHTWRGLKEGYRWSAAETDVPDGYTVHYSTAGTTVTITNRLPGSPGPKPPESPLLQTGQLNWPVPVLAGAGLGLCVLGWALLFVKRSRHES